MDQNETAKQANITAEINGEETLLTADPTDRLVDVLRESCGLTGTKIGCGIGRCGACAVTIDGKLVNACLTMAYQVDGKKVATIESVENDFSLDAIQEAFIESGGFQCGYCTPGMVMAAKALLDHNPSPSDEEIQQAMYGNICRCTGYAGIIRAVKHVMK